MKMIRFFKRPGWTCRQVEKKEILKILEAYALLLNWRIYKSQKEKFGFYTSEYKSAQECWQKNPQRLTRKALLYSHYMFNMLSTISARLVIVKFLLL